MQNKEVLGDERLPEEYRVAMAKCLDASLFDKVLSLFQRQCRMFKMRKTMSIKSCRTSQVLDFFLDIDAGNLTLYPYVRSSI